MQLHMTLYILQPPYSPPPYGHSTLHGLAAFPSTRQDPVPPSHYLRQLNLHNVHVAHHLCIDMCMYIMGGNRYDTVHM